MNFCHISKQDRKKQEVCFCSVAVRGGGQLFLMAGSAFWWQLSGDVRFTQS